MQQLPWRPPAGDIRGWWRLWCPGVSWLEVIGRTYLASREGCHVIDQMLLDSSKSSGNVYFSVEAPVCEICQLNMSKNQERQQRSRENAEQRGVLADGGQLLPCLAREREDIFPPLPWLLQAWGTARDSPLGILALSKGQAQRVPGWLDQCEAYVVSALLQVLHAELWL